MWREKISLEGTIMSFKSLDKYKASLRVKDTKGQSVSLYIFDKLKLDLENYIKTQGIKLGKSKLTIKYIKSRSSVKNVVFNKAVDFTRCEVPSERTLLSGTITNTNNTRYKGTKDKNYTYFCLKMLSGGKVKHVYMHNVLTESAWFHKNSTVMLEAYKRGEDQDGHTILEAKSIFQL